jgi:oligogalacturonide lyase
MPSGNSGAPEPVNVSGRRWAGGCHTERDPRSGRDVTRIDSGGKLAFGVYFECQAFTSGDRSLVFTSARTGELELYHYELGSGESVQLTSGLGDAGFSASVDPAGTSVWWISKQRLWSLHLETLSLNVHFANDGRAGDDLVPSPVSFTADGRFTALAVTRGGASRILRLDLHSSDVRIAAEWPDDLSHPIINPTDPDLISFVPGGNPCWDMDRKQSERARTWIADLRTGETRPLVIPSLYRTVTHESWSADGQRLFFFDKNWRVWTPVSICSMELSSGQWQAHYTDYHRKLGHGRESPDGHFFVSDCQDERESPLLLIDLRTGDDRILCWPNASDRGGHKEYAHVHPSFSRSGRFVTYTSDRTGVPQVYVVETSSDA